MNKQKERTVLVFQLFQDKSLTVYWEEIFESLHIQNKSDIVFRTLFLEYLGCISHIEHKSDIEQIIFR